MIDNNWQDAPQTNLGQWRRQQVKAIVAEEASAFPPREADVTDHACADLADWLSFIKEAREAGHTIYSADDPRSRTFGFIDDEKSICYNLSQTKVRAVGVIPPELAAYWGKKPEDFPKALSSEDSRAALLGHKVPTPPDEGINPQLETLWLQDAEMDRPQDEGVLNLFRPGRN